MSDPNTIHDDIAFMRKLAEQGRSGPILGGTFLIAAGLVFGLACVVQWAAMQKYLPLAGWDMLYLWGGAIALFAAGWFALFFRQRAKAGLPVNSANSIFGTVWSANAVGVLTAVAVVTMVGAATGSYAVYDLNISLPFVFYGVAWGVSGALAKRAWMYGAAVAAFVFAIILAALTGSPYQILGMGAALVLALSVPGYKLMTEEPRA